MVIKSCEKNMLDDLDVAFLSHFLYDVAIWSNDE
jgi:hypothetical protein